MLLLSPADAAGGRGPHNAGGVRGGSSAAQGHQYDHAFVHVFRGGRHPGPALGMATSDTASEDHRRERSLRTEGETRMVQSQPRYYLPGPAPWPVIGSTA